MNVAISINNLSVNINNNNILNNINLNINEGDCVAIVGKNGTGKTTLLKTINGLIRTKQNTIKLFNKDINNDLKKLVGYIPQENSFDKNLPISVKQVIEIGIVAKNGILKKFSKQDNIFIEKISNKLNIFNLLNMSIGKLSGGQLQKVSIARVLAQESKIILMDEPLNNLDKQSQKDFLNIIDTLHKENNTTILFATHNLELVPNCCNKIFKLPENIVEDYKHGNI